MKKLLDLLIIPELPIWIRRAGILFAFAALIPPLLILRARVSTSEDPRIHIIPDMDTQAKFKPQAENVLFRDGRAMRRPVEGTVARGGLEADSHFYRGLDFIHGELATVNRIEFCTYTAGQVHFNLRGAALQVFTGGREHVGTAIDNPAVLKALHSILRPAKLTRGHVTGIGIAMTTKLGQSAQRRPDARPGNFTPIRGELGAP